MKSYQFNYASGRPQMYDKKSRLSKGVRMVKTLEDYYGYANLKSLDVLDVGASTGIIDNYLTNYFGTVYGIDIDKDAILYAKSEFKKKNLTFKVGDALKLTFPDNKFDVVICTHVYEHVQNPKKLFTEIYRVLKPGGTVYLAAINSLWPIEPHYNLPFLSYIPKRLANMYVAVTGRAKKYYETPLNYWQLEILTKDFEKVDYTPQILSFPRKFGYSEYPTRLFLPLIILLSPILKYLTPTFFWILIKK